MLAENLLPMRNTNVTLTMNWQIFNSQECAAIVTQSNEQKWDSRLPMGPGNAPIFPDGKKALQTERQLLPLGKNAYPLDQIIFGISQINAENWRYDLNGVPADDMPWLVRQKKSKPMEEDWQVDLGAGFSSSRKLSYIVQLTNPDSYKGGDLKIWNVPIPEDVLRQQGTIIVFPSYCLHHTTPVTQGKRHFISGWIHGNNFR